MKFNFLTYFFFSIVLIPSFLLSQSIPDTIIAKVRIDNLDVRALDSLQFDLSVIRTSDNWDKWVNGTFQIGFADSSVILDPSSFQLTYVANSSSITPLVLGTDIGGNVLPKDSFYMTPRVFGGRISITVHGPEIYDDCQFFPKDSAMKIGTFMLKASSGRLPNYYPLRFKVTSDSVPYYYYQALAYKAKTEVYNRDKVWNLPDDNVEMYNDALHTKVEYEYDDNIPKMILDTFYVSYAGQKKDTLVWITISEPIHKGFILTRKLVPFGTSPDVDKTPFLDTIARWDSGQMKDTLLVGNIMHMKGHTYIYEFDTVPYRDETYCYELSYVDLNNTIIQLDTACIEIPDVLIYSAWAFPTSFKSQTTVRFRLEEESIVNITVFDTQGKLVTKLVENQKMGVGMHDVIFMTNEYSNQGLYDILIIAVPTEKMPIEIGKAVVKVQLVK